MEEQVVNIKDESDSHVNVMQAEKEGKFFWERQVLTECDRLLHREEVGHEQTFLFGLCGTSRAELARREGTKRTTPEGLLGPFTTALALTSSCR